MPKIKAEDKEDLIKIGMLEKVDGLYKMTPEAKAFCARLDNYFVKAKKKTDIRLEKIPGYTKIKKSIPKGLSVDIGKDKISIGYSKKF